MFDKTNNTKIESIVPKALNKLIINSAKENGRSRSQQIKYILMLYYADKNMDKKENAENGYLETI